MAVLALRDMIFDVARATPGVGELEESLKWGELSYVPKNKAGTAVRIDWKAKRPGEYAMYVHCQTQLIETFRTMFPDDFAFDGNRAIVFTLGEPVPQDALATCIAASLTYHLKKRRPRLAKRNSRA